MVISGDWQSLNVSLVVSLELLQPCPGVELEPDDFTVSLQRFQSSGGDVFRQGVGAEKLGVPGATPKSSGFIEGFPIGVSQIMLGL